MTERELLKKFAPGLPDKLNAYLCAPPVIEMTPECDVPFREDWKFRFFRWRGDSLPLKSLKFFPVFWMLFQAARSGALDGVHTLVEASSGNTAYCIVVLGLWFGIKNYIFYVPSTISAQKKNRLKNILGAKVTLVPCDNLPAGQTSVELAATFNNVRGYHNLGQYTNPNNPAGHAKFTAPWLFQCPELGGDGVHAVFAACGSNGTVTGIRDYCVATGKDTRLFGVIPIENSGSIPGARARSEIVGSFGWEKGISIVEVSASQAMLASAETLVGGPSSGLAFEGARAGIFKELVENKKDPVELFGSAEPNVVVICGDGMENYKELTFCP